MAKGFRWVARELVGKKVGGFCSGEMGDDFWRIESWS